MLVRFELELRLHLLNEWYPAVILELDIGCWGRYVCSADDIQVLITDLNAEVLVSSPCH